MLAKALSLRLKGVLNKIIDETQTAFVGGRNLLDSVICAREIIDDAKACKRQCFVFKADFRKAYDSVRWKFLYHMLHRLGFCSKWISWMKGCLESSSMSVLINGSPTTEFKNQRGLRQGDPLAPFLFLIVAQGLGGIMKQAVERNLFTGYRVGKSDLCISLLQFADDALFFGVPTTRNMLVLKSVLRVFEVMSGLKVNFNKSRVAGIYVSMNGIRRMKSVLNCQEMTVPFVYLGIPVGGRLRSVDTWNPVIEKMRNKLARWKNKELSLGGRICLIRAVLSSLPLFYLSLFRAPHKVIKSLNAIQKNFLWGAKSDKRSINWVSWNKVCSPKECGGLGIKNIEWFNAALLSKWMWRFMVEDTALWSQIIKARAKLNEDLVNQPATSKWWSDIVTACRSGGVHNWFWNNMRRILGYGKQTKFWEDRWAGEETLHEKYSRLYAISTQKQSCVSDFGNWDDGIWKWNFRWRRRLFAWEEELLREMENGISHVKLKPYNNDKWSWTEDSDEVFTVRSAYRRVVLWEELSDVDILKKVWSLQVPSSVAAMIWRAVLDRLPTKLNLVARNIMLSDEEQKCVLCREHPESINHILFACRVSSLVWSKCYNWLGYQIVNPMQLNQHFWQHSGMLNGKKKKEMWWVVWAAVVWTIWKVRNDIIFSNGDLDMDRIIDTIKFRSWMWGKAKSHMRDTLYNWSVQPLNSLNTL